VTCFPRTGPLRCGASGPLRGREAAGSPRHGAGRHGRVDTRIGRRRKPPAPWGYELGEGRGVSNEGSGLGSGDDVAVGEAVAEAAGSGIASMDGTGMAAGVAVEAGATVAVGSTIGAAAGSGPRLLTVIVILPVTLSTNDARTPGIVATAATMTRRARANPSRRIGPIGYGSRLKRVQENRSSVSPPKVSRTSKVVTPAGIVTVLVEA